MAEGAGCGAVKPETVTEGSRVGAREARQDCVMEGVELGFMRRMEMGWVVLPVMVGREGGGREFGSAMVMRRGWAPAVQREKMCSRRVRVLWCKVVGLISYCAYQGLVTWDLQCHGVRESFKQSWDWRGCKDSR